MKKFTKYPSNSNVSKLGINDLRVHLPPLIGLP